MSEPKEKADPGPSKKRRLIKYEDALCVSEDNAARRWVIRCQEVDCARISSVLGINLSGRALAAETLGERSILRLSPDEWLLLQYSDAPFQLDAVWAQEVVSIVEVSDRQTGIDVVGVRGAYALSTLCPLDLDLNVFPVGACTRTVFGRSEIVLWRKTKDIFHIEVFKSFADYVWRGLELAKKDIQYLQG